ncbi:hypothetical protein R3P38DRAFT_3078358 [Favolaschia claudopus]|uniref:Halogenase n=1 Tax=Favolaschia claudopus TaxID=2862362 RepID=A0AAV9ZVS5_9AGAR
MTFPVTAPPASTDILVIGGGPAGSYAAAALSREGFKVALLEREIFPRYHIGETLLSSLRPFLRFIDAEEKVKNWGFAVKVGAAVKLNQHKREGYTDFTLGGAAPERASWSVTRADFDELLLKHAASNGTSVHEGTRVTDIEFSTSEPAQPVSAKWKSDNEQTGSIKFNYLVDASGKNGIMSTRYLKNRKFTESLKNIAYWGYWTGAGMYGKGTTRENAVWIEALTDETGWAWFIPLHNDVVSVGVVLSDTSNKMKKAQTPDNKTHYLSQLKLVPGVMDFLANAKLTSEIKSAGDYSYTAVNNQYAGPNYRIIGDAGAFLDPLFSSGVHLAFTGGLSAAITICASARNHCSEQDAIAFHNDKVAVSYTRFLVVVLGVYQQIHAQKSSILSDIDEDNFDRAFDFIRPVIQGDADTHSKMSQIQKAVDLMSMSPGVVAIDPSTRERLSKQMDPALLTDTGPLLSGKALVEATKDDEEAKNLLHQMNSRKTITGMFDWSHNYAGDKLNGFSVRMKRGELGLYREEAA